MSTSSQDECSFVSLRDVERAMIVFTYFLDKMDNLRDLIDSKVVKNEHGPESYCLLLPSPIRDRWNRTIQLLHQLQFLSLQLLLTLLVPSFWLLVCAIIPDSVTGESTSKELLMSSLLH